MDSLNRIFQVIEYMNQHINDELSLDNLCIVSGYTKSHLSYLFKFYIGETPKKYFYKQKLRYGANLLFGSENVLDVALKTGFSSHEAFTRAFKKEFGMTPIEYRKLHYKGLSILTDLNEIELTMTFSASPAYRVFLGLDKFGKYYDVYQSLINKGFIDNQSLDSTLEGKQLIDKYYWDCSMVMIELSKVFSTLEELYENTIKLINIPKPLFFKFAYDLVDVGKMRNIFL